MLPAILGLSLGPIIKQILSQWGEEVESMKKIGELGEKNRYTFKLII